MFMRYCNLKSILLPSLIFISSCQGENKQLLWQDEARVVSGAIQLKSPADGANLVMYIIDKNGEKVKVDNFTSSQGRYEFVLDNLYFLDPPFISKADKIVSLEKSELFPEPDKQDLYKVRMLLINETFGQDSGETAIYHKMIPVSRNDILISTREVEFSEPINPEPAGFQKVSVVDENSAPIPDASVIGFMTGNIRNEKNEVTFSWMQEKFRPIIHKTNAEGQAILYPLDRTNEKSSYILIAWAPGYCTWVSAPLRIVAEEGTTLTSPTVSLKKCDEASEDAMGLKISYHSNTLTYQESPDGSEESVSMAYFNNVSYGIRVDSFSPFIRPLTIALRESHDANGSKNDTVEDLSLESSVSYSYPFQSDLFLSLPNKFIETGTSDGTFTINATIKKDDKDASARLYGRKKTSSPSIAFMSDLIIAGLRTNKVISGISGQTLFLSSSFCQSGFELGIRFSSEIYFSPCTEEKATINVTDLTIPGSTLQIGSMTTVRMFIKDKFKNISADDLLNENELEIFVDYSNPDLASSPLTFGTHFGIVQTGAEAAQNPFPTAGQPVTLTPANISSFSMRFPYADACTARSGDKGDGVLLGNQGIKISEFTISATAPTPNRISTETNESTQESQPGDATTETTIPTTGPTPIVTGFESLTFTPCEQNQITLDHPLTTASMQFGTNQDDATIFYLSVRDLAGNYSDPYEYKILHCDSASLPQNAKWCWNF